MKIDASQLQTYIQCPARYSNQYIKNLAKIKYDEREVNMDFGKCGHLAIEYLYKGKPMEEVKKIFRDKFIGLEDNNIFTPHNGEIVIEAYWNYWQKPISDFSDVNFTNLAIEQINTTMKLNEDIEWIVKIDRVAKNNAGIWYIDHKFTSRSLHYFFNDFWLNMAVSGYCYYVREKYGQCSGFIPDVISLGYRKKAYKGEPAGFHYDFVRDIVNRSNDELNNWKDNAIKWCYRLMNEKDFPRCESGYVCAKCSYRELCISGNDINIEQTLYQKVNPFEYLTIERELNEVN